MTLSEKTRTRVSIITLFSAILVELFILPIIILSAVIFTFGLALIPYIVLIVCDVKLLNQLHRKRGLRGVLMARRLSCIIAIWTISTPIILTLSQPLGAVHSRQVDYVAPVWPMLLTLIILLVGLSTPTIFLLRLYKEQFIET